MIAECVEAFVKDATTNRIRWPRGCGVVGP
jgi:hypothetical protein